MARAVILRPKLVLADEPTGSLDLKIGEEVQELLFRLNKEHNIALVVATHNRDFAKKIGRQVELREGAAVRGLGSARANFLLYKSIGFCYKIRSLGRSVRLSPDSIYAIYR